MTLVELAQIDGLPRVKRRYLDLATMCMRYSVRLEIAAAIVAVDPAPRPREPRVRAR